MHGKTFAALATVLTVVAAASPSALAACTSAGCTNINVDINAEVPENFGFGTANGNFSANADADSVEMSGDNGAIGTAARGGEAQGSNTITVNGTAANGATGWSHVHLRRFGWPRV